MTSSPAQTAITLLVPAAAERALCVLLEPCLSTEVLRRFARHVDIETEVAAVERLQAAQYDVVAVIGQPSASSTWAPLIRRAWMLVSRGGTLIVALEGALAILGGGGARRWRRALERCRAGWKVRHLVRELSGAATNRWYVQPSLSRPLIVATGRDAGPRLLALRQAGRPRWRHAVPFAAPFGRLFLPDYAAPASIWISRKSA